jgi:PAS domain S-box-containing protein
VKVVSQIRRYGLAVIACGLALAVAWALDAPTSCFFLAVMVSSLYGGRGPGLFAVALSSLAFDYFFLTPVFHLGLDRAAFLRFGPFLVASLLVAILIDRTRQVEEARRRIAAQVQRSEAYLAEAQKLSRSGSWASAPDHPEATYFSEEMFRIMGLPPSANPPHMEEIAALFAPEVWVRVTEMFNAASLNKTTFDGEYPLRSRDGVERVVRFVGHPVLSASGEILEIVGTAIDITEQRQARAALQRAFDEIKGSEDRLRLIIDSIPVPAWSSRPDGSSDFINQRWLDYTGIPSEQALDWGWKSVVHPDDLERTMDYWRSVLASDWDRELEARLRRFDGTYRWFLFRVSPLRDESGRVVQWYGACVDIEDRKCAEEALRSREQQLRSMLDSIPALVTTMTPAGDSEMVNEQLVAYTGQTPQQLKNWSEKVHPEDRGGLVELWRRSLESGDPYEADERVRRADGVYRWFHTRGLPMRDAEGKIVRWCLLLTDIEDRKRAEESLSEREHDLSRIIETMPGLVWCAAANGELTYVNQRILDYTGTNREALAMAGWVGFLHPDDVLPTVRAWSHSLETGQPYEVQYRFRRFDGGYRWFHVLGQQARGTEGHRTRWYGLLIDIDDRKNMEEALRNTQERLSRAAQTATVGEFAAAIAHEINQPLAAVVANGHACLRWLSAEPPNLAKAHEAAERIVRDGSGAGEVIRRIRALFKRDSLEKTALDMNEIITEVLRVTQSEVIRRGVAVETELERGLPCVAGDRVQLQQLLFNLLINGMEAMEGIADRPKRLFIRSKQQAGESVLVEVRDCGPGLADPDKAFEAFFTTKENGLGMGLAICRSVVEAHHGRLWAESANGVGATFCFTLPKHRVSPSDRR